MKLAFYETDGLVLKSGEACQAMQIIYEGEVEYFTQLTEGVECAAFYDRHKEEILKRKAYRRHNGYRNQTIDFAFERLGKGSILNTYSFIDKQVIQETARCTKPTTIFYLPTSNMQELCCEFPDLGDQVKKYLTKIALSSFKSSEREIVFDFIKYDTSLETMNLEQRKIEQRNNALLVKLKDHMLRKFSSYKKQQSMVSVFQKAKKLIRNQMMKLRLDN